MLPGVTVGLQHGPDVVEERAADGADVSWTLDVRVVDGGPRPDFRGPYVHGRTGERYLYLSWQRDGEGMFRRAKLMLDPLSPELLAVAQVSGLRGATSLTMPDGTPLCAAVRPPTILWSAGSAARE